jgi:hypothetical protein
MKHVIEKILYVSQLSSHLYLGLVRFLTVIHIEYPLPEILGLISVLVLEYLQTHDIPWV